MDECAVIVVTYYPKKEDLINIHDMSTKVKKVYVIDNTPGGVIFSCLKKNILLWKCYHNKGLAAGLNIGLRLAIGDGYNYMFLFDQDSRPSGNFFKNMLAFQKKTEEIESDCAFIVPNFFDTNSKTFARFPIINPYRFYHTQCSIKKMIIPDYALIAITSGTLISRDKYEAIGPFREDYFIDFIDNEYCLRAYAKGYRVIVNCMEILEHSIGKRSTEKILGLTLKPNNHNMIRRYYIARNGIRTALEYGASYPSYCVLIMARLIHEALSIIIFEKKKSQKSKAICHGIFHGLINKMGKNDGIHKARSA